MAEEEINDLGTLDRPVSFLGPQVLTWRISEGGEGDTQEPGHHSEKRAYVWHIICSQRTLVIFVTKRKDEW